MLFLNYISDLWDDHVETYRKRYRGDEACIRRRLEPERFVMPEGASFRELYEQRNEPNIGELINIVLEDIEDRNRAKLEGVFRNIAFNSEANLGRTKDCNRRLKNLLEDFAKPALDLRPSRVTGGIIGECRGRGGDRHRRGPAGDRQDRDRVVGGAGPDAVVSEGVGDLRCAGERKKNHSERKTLDGRCASRCTETREQQDPEAH